MRQAAAILWDSYRELNARRLFWVALALSLLIVCIFLAVGITERGLKFLWWEIPAFINTSLIAPSTFYKFMFMEFGVKVWLTFGATILALVSTSSIVPDLVRLGSIELVLSRPIGRIRLFLLKYLSGLLFVGVQVLVFTTASFIVIGVRGGAWEWGLFLAIPIVVLFFSYLFAACVLLGILTRSGNAALLITVLLWLIIGGVHVAEREVLKARLGSEARVASIASDVRVREEQLALAERENRPAEETGRLRTLLEDRRRFLAERQAESASAARWHDGLYAAKTVLPKTNETTDLLERYLVEPDEVSTFLDAQQRRARNRGRADELEATRRAEDALRTRPLWWVLGTSIAFELAVLSLAAWLFWRRDF